MANISINNKVFEFTESTNILVLDTFLEINQTPTTIYYQKDLGILPTGYATNSLYYNWQPNTLMTIITGTTEGIAYEIYWIYSFKKTANIFTTNQVQEISQSLVKLFKRGQDNGVIFNGTNQQISVLAESGSDVSEPIPYDIHHYDFAVFHGNQFLDTGIYFKNNYAVECVAKLSPQTCYIFGFVDETFSCSMNTFAYTDKNFAVEVSRPDSNTHQNIEVTYPAHITEGSIRLIPSAGNGNTLAGDSITPTAFSLPFISGVSTQTMIVGATNWFGTVSNYLNGKISRFRIRNMENRGAIYQAIPASVGDDFGFHVREINDFGVTYEKFVPITGLTCDGLNDTISFI